MKRLFTIFWLLAALSASAQINRIEYFWNTDPGFGNGIALPITLGDSVASVFSFSTVGLQPGIHTLYVRSRDASGRWSVASKKGIQINQPIYPIAAAEYYYDTDPGFGNGTALTVTPGDSILLADALPTGALAPGIHSLYVRTRDTNGKWSIFSKRLVHVLQPFYPIAEAEYFFDTDPGFGNGTAIAITPGDSLDLMSALNTASLTPGIHTAYIRVKSSNNEWSTFSKRLVHIQYPEAEEIIAAEYFIDSDPGIGNATAIPLTSGDSVLASFQVPTGSLSLGIHMLYVRVKDANQQWSVHSKKLLYIDNPADDPIVAAEYFFDTDPGIGNATPITITPGDSIVANFSAPTNSLLIGAHWIHVRVQDAEGRWSAYSRDSFYVDNFDCLVYGNGEIELSGDTCRGTELTFKDKTISNSGVNSADYSYEWNFSNDTVNTFTDSVVTNTFNQIGTYTVTLKVYETLNPVCQELVTKTFTIRRVDSTFSAVTICDGDSILAAGAYRKTAGTYYANLSNRYGCDSVHATTVSVTPNVTPSITIATNDLNVCSGFSTLFTATAQNGGSNYYTWKVNGIVVAQGYHFQGYFQYSSTTLADNDAVTCDLTSDITCTTQSTVTSNTLVMNVTQSVAASITIDVDTNDFCSGTLATFTITDTVNQGENPQYVWYINNFIPVQTGGTSYSSANLGNGEVIRAYLYSDAVCVNNSPASSNVIQMVVSTSGFPDVSIQASTNSVCYGTPITFTAFTSLGGNNPHYQWFLNDTLVQNGASNIYVNDSINHEDEVTCVLTSDYQCRLADTDTSNTITMDIIYALPVSVTLVPSGNNICAGTGVNFTAFPTNAGSPTYEFFVNGISVQNGASNLYGTTPNNNDSVWVVVTSDISCATNNPATSDTIKMTMVAYDTVSVSITATDDSICQGTKVVFTANAVNPGINPTYIWYVNNFQAQATGVDTFASSSLGDGSIVRCDVYASHQCPTPYPATSNNITISVTDTLLPSVQLSIPQTTTCNGTEVDFTATLNNEGVNPVVEWLVNNTVVQTGGLNYTSSTLQDFDVVRVRLTVDYACPVQNPVLSNAVTMTVLDSITPAVFVYHGPNPACPGNLISVFTSTTTGGDAPTYEFRVNGNLVQSGINNQYNSAALSDGEVIQVTMTSNAECLRTATALSNFDTIRINSFIPADVSIQAIATAQCAGELSAFEATPVNGGFNPIYTWRINNAVVQSGTLDTFSTTALQNGDSVYCEMSSTLSCATNNPAVSNTIYILLQSCASCDSVDCNDNDLCTADTCINGTCSNTALDCSDGIACTIDKCEDGDCEHADVICDDSSLCTFDNCNANGVCVFTPLDCSDNDACTDDVCVEATGECANPAVICPPDVDGCTIETCDVALGCISTPKDCSDGEPCTSDLCQDNNCFNPPIVCTPANACFTSICDNGTCIQIPVVCNDNDICTDDGCDIVTGCIFTAVNCSDASACTLDSCSQQSGCFNTPVVCDDADVCTINGCDSLLGCVFPQINCSDNNGCTNDFCDTLGVCNNDTIPGCNNQCDTLVCNDNDLCTADGCNPQTGCVFTTINCTDASACTLDSCTTQTGCFYTDVVCTDADACTINGCDIVGGCFVVAVNCDDGNPCTTDDCDAATGCFNDSIPGCGNLCDTLVCNDNDVCTTDDCDAVTGCIFTSIICNDATACTLDSCNAQTGCFYTPIICTDADACTINSCDPIISCITTTVNCDDGNACTSDGCDIISGCFNDSIPGCGNPCDTLVCADNSLCTTDTCTSGQCLFTAINCNDSDACTDDTCEPLLGCQYAAINCDDNNACTTDDCNVQTGCFNTTIDCNDNDACTDDACDIAAGCQYSAHNCDDTDACTIDACDAQTGCFYTPVVCNDNDACTDESCDFNLGCQYVPHNCNDADACTIDACNALTGCFYTPVDCNDNDACTAESCDFNLGCQYAPHNCNDADACTIDVCDAQTGCLYTDVVCNDNDACTDDACNALLGCQFTLHNCDDANACTLDDCNAQTGCFYADIICDDNDACTDDTCNAALGCLFTPVSCDDNDLCTVDKCEFGVCVNAPVTCNDGDVCTTDSCVGGTCQFTQITCNDNDVCTTDTCNGGCSFTPVVCDDADGCTNDFCDQITGCFTTPLNCDDGEICTFDFCDNGACMHDCDTNSNHELLWQTALGGTSADEARSIHQTADGGYVVTGHSYSADGDVSNNYGHHDFWVTRLDATGTLLWQKSLGGGKGETANAVRQTADSGYILAGNTKSNDGDVSGNHGGEDYWIVKLDATGALQWQQALGGTNADIATSVEQTNDGGYIVAGWTSSNNGNVSGNHGGSDYWLVKLDATGAVQWQKTLGGTSSDQAYSVQQTADDGYIVLGNTKSNNGDVTGNHGASDYWAVKLNNAGSIEWQKALGGSNAESAQAVRQTNDGGYIIAGSSKSGNGDVSDNYGSDDFWIVKLDATANLLWEKNLGGSADDIAQSIDLTADGGFIVAGSSKSNNNDVSGNHGNDDFWVVRLDAAGNLQWQKSLGGNKKDYAYSTQQTKDEGFVIAGFTDSHNNGDVTGHNRSSDFWVVKLAADRVCRPVTELSVAICVGDSVLVGSEYVNTSGTYYDTLVNNIGCDSTIAVTLTVADCNDNDPCTIDACANGACSHTPVICDDDNDCTLDDCDVAHNGCFYTLIVCDDSNQCTEDACHFGICQYEAIICNDNNDCTMDACTAGICEFTDERRVLSFTLVSAATDADVGLLNDGDVIDLFITGPINIRADVCATSNIESVRFQLNGSNYVMENIPFYTIAGDNGGNYNPWNIQPGEYTIRAIPYSGNNGTGITGIYNEITITIIDGTPPCAGNARKVVDFTLVSATTEADLGVLIDGAVIDLAVTGPINVRANVCLENNIESVRFLLNGSNYVMENIPFYTIAGDNNGNYNTWNVQPGVYTIRAIPYSGNNGAGTVGDYHEITITIIGGIAPCQQGQNRVFSLTLVDADDDTDIATLANGAIIDLSVTGPINIRANICQDNIVESVKFLLNSTLFRTENEAPYLLAGDNNGNYHTWNVQPGVYTIRATPYTGNNGGGTAGAFNEVTVTVISGNAAKMEGETTLSNSASVHEMQVNAYPNPFNDQLNIEFTLAESSRVKLEIFSVTGQKIATLFEGNVKADELQHFEFNPENVSDGVFIYRLQTETETYYGKTLMVR